MTESRIKQRPILFVTWLTSAVLLLTSVATFFKGFGYFGETRQVLFVTGGLLIQDSPTQGVVIGLRFFDVSMPNRSVESRIRGFLLPPQHLGKALWIPLGLPLGALATLFSWLFWRSRGHAEGCCRECGYDLTGNTTGVCPECGAAIIVDPTALQSR